jgi:hypothetical protein
MIKSFDHGVSPFRSHTADGPKPHSVISMQQPMCVRQQHARKKDSRWDSPVDPTLLIEAEELRSYFDTSARTQWGCPFALREINPAFAWQCNRQETGSCFLRGIEACPEVSKGANRKRIPCSLTTMTSFIETKQTSRQSPARDQVQGWLRGS